MAGDQRTTESADGKRRGRGERAGPANLEMLYGAFGRESIENIYSGEAFTIGDVEFVCKYSPESTSRRFFILKTVDLFERYRRHCEGPWKGARIVELGIAEGGAPRSSRWSRSRAS